MTAPLITDPADRAQFARHLTRLRLLGAAIEARAGAGRPPDHAQIVEAVVSIRALRAIAGIENTRRAYRP